MTSFEYIDEKGKAHAVKPIRNLSGHSISPYRIHGGHTVPIVKTDDQTKMLECACYAIETFGSTGRGRVFEEGESSHFMQDFEFVDKYDSFDKRLARIRNKKDKAKDLYTFLDQRFHTLPFCRRWIADESSFGAQHFRELKNLIDADIIVPYPPLCDERGSFTAQYEHTIINRPTCKEVVSRGQDY